MGSLPLLLLRAKQDEGKLCCFIPELRGEPRKVGSPTPAQTTAALSYPDSIGGQNKHQLFLQTALPHSLRHEGRPEAAALPRGSLRERRLCPGTSPPVFLGWQTHTARGLPAPEGSSAARERSPAPARCLQPPPLPCLGLQGFGKREHPEEERRRMRGGSPSLERAVVCSKHSSDGAAACFTKSISSGKAA